MRCWHPRGNLRSTGTCAVATLEGHTAEPTRAVFSPDGEILASSFRAGEILIWSVPGFDLRESITVRAAD
jgi:WD40 repeat protein